MGERLSMKLPHGPSDNRKSKIHNRKWLALGIFLPFFLYGVSGLAQPQGKVPRIGYR